MFPSNRLAAGSITAHWTAHLLLAKRRTWSLLLLLGLIPVLTLAPMACTTDAGDGTDLPPPGAIQVTWRITQMNLGCDATGISQVVLELSNQGQPAYSQAFACTAMGGLIQNVTAGAYEVLLRGLDKNGKMIYKSVLSNQEISSGLTEIVGPLYLERLPATIKMAWFFANGYTCTRNEVKTVKLTIFDKVYLKPLMEPLTFECEYEPIWYIQEVQPTNIWVIASGLGADGTPVFHADVERQVVAGEEVVLDLKLEACPAAPSNIPGC